MKVGQIVKFKSPQTPEEASERFTIVEARGDRMLVQCVGSAFGDWSIKPQAVYLVADLKDAAHDTAAQAEYAVHGFNLITTGGNCTALHKPMNDDGSRYVLVTVPDDAEAPTKRGELVRVGLYGPDHSEELDTFMASSAEEVGAVIKVKGWK